MQKSKIDTAPKVGAVPGASVPTVYKPVSERLLRSLVVLQAPQYYGTQWGAVRRVVDPDMRKDVPVAIRRQLYTTIFQHQSANPAEDLARYHDAMRLVVEDKSIQGGAATFKGTRILVHQIADLLAEGVGEMELRADYPRVTPAMLAAAPIYARAHPKRGRPRMPAWRNNTAIAQWKVQPSE